MLELEINNLMFTVYLTGDSGGVSAVRQGLYQVAQTPLLHFVVQRRCRALRTGQVRTNSVPESKLLIRELKPALKRG
jgi:hypothetical protein